MQITEWHVHLFTLIDSAAICADCDVLCDSSSENVSTSETAFRYWIGEGLRLDYPALSFRVYDESVELFQLPVGSVGVGMIEIKTEVW